jgi:hypothetical protein
MNQWMKRKVHEIEPDEIFLDASNLPEHNTERFEGRVVKSLPAQAVLGVAAVFFSHCVHICGACI